MVPTSLHFSRHSFSQKNELIDTPAWAVIKTAPPDDECAQEELRREYDVYHLPQVATSPHIRAIYDIISYHLYFDSQANEIIPCLALEWMDLTLADLSWCIAKIRRLFPDWTPSPINDDIRQSDFRLGIEFIEDFPEINNISSLEDEVHCVHVAGSETSASLSFVVDPEKRPSAAEVLKIKGVPGFGEKSSGQPRMEEPRT
ncbi:hypothetical protein GGR54DRAFT_337877 [Hypoxylon sp. NC1633]|nr:hypothetical protein GGR54DRAFT_337877 [Hypoxylon sp. NC1633]